MLFWTLFLLSITVSSAYRIGDVVDTIRKADDDIQDCFRNQMPVFGTSTSVEFPDTSTGIKRFSLAFEEGLRPLPWVYMKDSQGYSLAILTIEFGYSKSSGTIHSISASPKYGQRSKNKQRSFLVKYKWVEEVDVDPRSAIAMTYLVTIATCMVMLAGSCCGGGKKEKPLDQLDEKVHGYEYAGGYQQQQPGVPKWD